MNKDSFDLLVKNRLIKKFKPHYLVIKNESFKHKGHLLNNKKNSHYFIDIKSDVFFNKSKIEIHKMIYKELYDLIGKDIHSLKIKASDK